MLIRAESDREVELLERRVVVIGLFIEALNPFATTASKRTNEERGFCRRKRTRNNTAFIESRSQHLLITLIGFTFDHFDL
jgi:hypothetical protein